MSVVEESTRCSTQPGQAHSKLQEHPVPANSTADLIEGIEVGIVRRTSDQRSLRTLAQLAASIGANLVSLTPSPLDHPPSFLEPPPIPKSCCAPKRPPKTVKEDTGPVRGPCLPRLLLGSEQTFPPPRDVSKSLLEPS